ncbi:UNVERIFIED_CONTAM: hypothetical protein HDU68_000102 [Siphonaria sp. JEL0065]|nr:hypothetical protein HDU68_000102 [Siphonaria sp. JEL0065]
MTGLEPQQALNTSGIGRGFDVHIYFDLTADSISKVQVLHKTLQQEFPALCVFPLVGRPVGPHTKPMFQAVVVTAQEFGAVERNPYKWPLDTFTPPIIRTDGNAWDFHIYYRLEDQSEFAKALYEKVQTEFPTLKIFRLWDKPIGPHTLPMFEVDVFTPQEFGVFLSWIALNRGTLSVLAHPHTAPGNDVEDHLVHGVWVGERVPLIRAALEPHD